MTTTARVADGADVATTDPDAQPASPVPAAAEPFAPWLGWLMAVAGGLGLLAAADLNIERSRLLEDPDFVPSCSFNVLLDCGAVALSDQASLFGFSNTIIGVAAFPVVLALAAVVVAGGTLPRAVWLGLNAGLLGGVVFVHWLIYVSSIELGTLCPWCMVVWSATIPLFWYVTLRNLAAGAFGSAARDSGVVRVLRGIHLAPVALWFVAVAAFLGVRFADSWAAML